MVYLQVRQAAGTLCSTDTLRSLLGTKAARHLASCAGIRAGCGQHNVAHVQPAHVTPLTWLPHHQWKAAMQPSQLYPLNCTPSTPQHTRQHPTSLKADKLAHGPPACMPSLSVLLTSLVTRAPLEPSQLLHTNPTTHPCPHISSTKQTCAACLCAGGPLWPLL